MCVIVNVRAPGAKTAVKRLKRLHGVEVLVMDSKSQERLLRRLEELLVGSDGNADKDDGHGARRIRFLAGGGDGTIAAAASLIALACERAGLAPGTPRPGRAPAPRHRQRAQQNLRMGSFVRGRAARENRPRRIARVPREAGHVDRDDRPERNRAVRRRLRRRVRRREETSHSTQRTRERKFCCFFSVGFDAHISHRFTRRRERDPKSCATAWQNKAWYAYYGAAEFVAGGGRLLGEDGKPSVELRVDGRRIHVGRDLNSVQVFNIHSSADGVDFWGTNRASVKRELPDDAFAPPCVGDGMLEVVGTRGVSDLVAARGGFSRSRGGWRRDESGSCGRARRWRRRWTGRRGCCRRARW